MQAIPAPTSKPRGSEILTLFLIAACLIVVLGAKLWLIGADGNVTPYWDQWDAEAASLFKPYLTGTLTNSDLFAAHNEHRIFWTRLIALALLKLNGGWDPVAEMALNAMIHVLALGVFLFMLSRILDAASTIVLALFAMVVLSIPFGWENILWGFQSQFYLLILFGFLSLYLLAESAAWSPRWFAGTFVALCGYLTVASGALTLCAFMAIAFVQLASRQRSGAREWAALACHGAITALLLFDVPHIPLHDPLRAHSAGELAESLFAAASWPLAASQWPTVWRAAGAAFLYAPVAVFCWRLLGARPGAADKRWLVAACAVWIGLQIAALALGRARDVLSSRYLDILIIAAVLNFGCLIHLMRTSAAGSLLRRGLSLAALIWIGAVLSGIGQKAFDNLPQELAHWRDLRITQADNLKNYLATGDATSLIDKPVPYPEADRLQSLVSDPVIRAILPPELFGAIRNAPLKQAVLRAGPRLLVPIGFAVFLVISLTISAGLERRPGAG